jgi:undecaprenyl-phosphate galactose phosphotransferase
MSLVGPRPCLPYEYEVYDDWHKRRIGVRPGCTGLWQVTGRSETSYDDMVVLDIYYLQNISPWFDLQLLLKTIPVIIKGKGGE